MSATEKQLDALKVIGQGHEPGAEAIDFDQLLEQLSWKPTKAAAHFMLRSMVKKGLIEKGPLEHRRGARRRLFRVTPGGAFELRCQPGAGVEIESEFDDEPLSLEDVADIVAIPAGHEPD